jgi:hypothetical protein
MTACGVIRLRASLVAVAALGATVIAGTARADVASDKPAAVVLFPKLLVDSESGLDTLVRLSNVSDKALNVLCYYVNVTPRCSLPGGACFPDGKVCPVQIGDSKLFGECVDQWQPTDFLIRLTREQPTAWLVSKGASVNCRFLSGRCSNDDTKSCQRNEECASGGRCVLPPCLPLEGPPQGRTGRDGQVNEGLIPVSPEDPFIGELQCVALDESLAPAPRNDLIGEALIGRWERTRGFIDVAGYNAIGIPAISNKGNRDQTLVLGGPTGNDPQRNPDDQACRQQGTCAEYEGCPGILILDHFFDGAEDPWVRNRCIDDKCSITGNVCQTSADCEKNVCGGGGKCTVSGGECVSDDDCINSCEPNERCRLSNRPCRSSADCAEASYDVRVNTNLTLVPCTQDYETRNFALSRTIAQFLVYNEFEQRFSTSTEVECFKEIRLSNIETEDNSRSIFSAGVAGTLTGQTRIRGVVTAPAGGGNALLGVAEEFRCGGPRYQFPKCNFVAAENLVSSTAKNLHSSGRRPQRDFIYLAPR